MLEETIWNPTAVIAVLTVIGAIIDKTITSFYNGRKLAMIEAHVNSQKTADSTKIQYLENEAKMLREQAAENARIAAVLAQTASIRTREADVKDGPKVLEEIKKNTGDTVKAVKKLGEE